MGLRNLFDRKNNAPDTRGLQKGEQKKAKTREIVLPPRDEKGRFVPDRSKKQVSSKKSKK